MSTEPADTEGTNFSNIIPTASEVEFAETPVDRLQQQENTKGEGYEDGRILLTTWADHHDIIHPLLPLSHRCCDPIDVGVTVADKLESFPKTQKGFQLKQLGIGNVTAEMTAILLRRHRCPPNGKSGKRKRYRNPSYCHYDEWFDPIQDRDDRREFYTDYIAAGVEPEWIASHLGFTVDELRQFVRDHTDHPPLAEHLHTHRARIAKSAYTTVVWSSWTMSDVSRALHASPSCLREWIQEHVRNTAWKPPCRPMQASWFPYSRPEDEDAADTSTQSA